MEDDSHVVGNINRKRCEGLPEKQKVYSFAWDLVKQWF